MHTKFLARAKGDSFPAVPVFPVRFNASDTRMAIGVDDLEIYISKAQAMAFFNLVEPSKVAAHLVATVHRENEFA